MSLQLQGNAVFKRWFEQKFWRLNCIFVFLWLLDCWSPFRAPAGRSHTIKNTANPPEHTFNSLAIIWHVCSHVTRRTRNTALWLADNSEYCSVIGWWSVSGGGKEEGCGKYWHARGVVYLEVYVKTWFWRRGWAVRSWWRETSRPQVCQEFAWVSWKGP